MLIDNGVAAGTEVYRAFLTGAAETGTPIHQALAGEVIVIEHFQGHSSQELLRRVAYLGAAVLQVNEH